MSSFLEYFLTSNFELPAHKNHRDDKGSSSSHFAPGFAQKDWDAAELEAPEDVTFSKNYENQWKSMKIYDKSMKLASRAMECVPGLWNPPQIHPNAPKIDDFAHM